MGKSIEVPFLTHSVHTQGAVFHARSTQSISKTSHKQERNADTTESDTTGSLVENESAKKNWHTFLNIIFMHRCFVHDT